MSLLEVVVDKSECARENFFDFVCFQHFFVRTVGRPSRDLSDCFALDCFEDSSGRIGHSYRNLRSVVDKRANESFVGDKLKFGVHAPVFAAEMTEHVHSRCSSLLNCFCVLHEAHFRIEGHAKEFRVRIKVDWFGVVGEFNL